MVGFVQGKQGPLRPKPPTQVALLKDFRQRGIGRIAALDVMRNVMWEAYGAALAEPDIGRKFSFLDKAFWYAREVAPYEAPRLAAITAVVEETARTTIEVVGATHHVVSADVAARAAQILAAAGGEVEG